MACDEASGQVGVNLLPSAITVTRHDYYVVNAIILSKMSCINVSYLGITTVINGEFIAKTVSRGLPCRYKKLWRRLGIDIQNHLHHSLLFPSGELCYMLWY